MQPYPCATTTVTPAGRTALCPLPSILGAIGHLHKTKDLFDHLARSLPHIREISRVYMTPHFPLGGTVGPVLKEYDIATNGISLHVTEQGEHPPKSVTSS